MPPTFGNGKICYVLIPATDIPVSAEFYKRVFGWNVRKSDDGSASFDDGVGEVSWQWVTGLAPAASTSLSIHIMVDDMDATLAAVVANGGEIVDPPRADSPENTATFRDPGGNVMGLYQHGG
jgi:predicted enzyme related to lactoylglutathione lyase